MGLPVDLAEQIDATRITYPEREAGGVTIRGAPFVCEFNAPVDPETFCETITTLDPPWFFWGLPITLSENGNGYWKIKGLLFPPGENKTGDRVDITLEVASEWVRIYVKEDANEHRVAEFVRTLDNEYGVTVEFTSQNNEPEEQPV